MKMPSYLESRAEAYGGLEELQIDLRAARACTPGWDITVIAGMPQKGVTMKIKPEFILGQQLAIRADEFLEIIDKFLKSVTGGQMIMREQEAAGVCYLYAKRGHISVNCPGLKLGGPQNKVERIGSWYQSTINMRNLPKLYEIRKKPILDPGATMHQRAGTGIWWHCNMPKYGQKQQHKKVARNKCNRNWQSSRHNDVEAVDQVFGANKVEIKQKTLEALGLLRQADHALDNICKCLADCTEYV
jgi:hypothetical protein